MAILQILFALQFRILFYHSKFFTNTVLLLLVFFFFVIFGLLFLHTIQILFYFCCDWFEITVLTMAEMRLLGFLFPQQHEKYCFLISITSHKRPIFRVVSCHDLLCQDWVICTHTSVRNQRTSEPSIAESKCADTGANEPSHSSAECQKRGACVLCCKPHGSLSHFSRVSLKATVLTKGRTIPQGADLDFSHQAKRRGRHFAFRAVGSFFSRKNAFEQSSFPERKMYLKRFLRFSKKKKAL